MMLMTGIQEGDRFVRLPEVYVKGNNVSSKRFTIHSYLGVKLTAFRSNILECPTRLSTRSASHRRASKAVSEADEEDNQEVITADVVTVDGVVVVEAEDGDEVNKSTTMIGDDYLAHLEPPASDLKHLMIRHKESPWYQEKRRKPDPLVTV